jgi:preprotein translocase subunit YajC
MVTLDMLILGDGAASNPAFLFAIMIAMVAFIFISNRQATSREKKRFAELMASIKKNDRVMTVGGIIGSVVSTTPEEVVLKVDESANVKITFVRSAIKKVLTEEPKSSDLK